MTTFSLPAECGRLIEYDTVEDLKQLRNEGLLDNFLPIGGGSNLLFVAGRFDGSVLHCTNTTVEISSDKTSDTVEITAAAGCSLDKLCAQMCVQGLWGLENLSGIPGEIGGAAVQNVGAYGTEFREVVKTVQCFDPATGREINLDNEQCHYGYRDSIFKHKEGKHLIITGVVMSLSTTPRPNLSYAALAAAFNGIPTDNLCPADFRKEVMRLRNSKLPDPDVTGSAGSFFKNPVVSTGLYQEMSAKFGSPIPGHPVNTTDQTDCQLIKLSAAWLIDNAGCKSFSHGGASLWPTQPLVIVNTCGHATGADVVALEQRIIQTVKKVFGVELTPEVIHIKP